jgi:hypothetical protein
MFPRPTSNIKRQTSNVKRPKTSKRHKSNIKTLSNIPHLLLAVQRHACNPVACSQPSRMLAAQLHARSLVARSQPSCMLAVQRLATQMQCSQHSFRLATLGAFMVGHLSYPDGVLLFNCRYGRLAWDPAVTSEELTVEWAEATFGVANGGAVAQLVERILGVSWEAYENYTASLGWGFVCNSNHYAGDNLP